MIREFVSIGRQCRQGACPPAWLPVCLPSFMHCMTSGNNFYIEVKITNKQTNTEKKWEERVTEMKQKLIPITKRLLCNFAYITLGACMEYISQYVYMCTSIYLSLFFKYTPVFFYIIGFLFKVNFFLSLASELCLFTPNKVGDSLFVCVLFTVATRQVLLG